jgi:histidine ammonia-lyase
MSTVTITEDPLAIEDLLAVVEGARVELSDSVRAVIAASRAVVDRALSRNEGVYGLTTQIGHGKDTQLTEEEIRGEQMFLVMSHSGGVGPPLPTPQVRAALAVRLNGIARGGSGASPAVADALAEMLNAGVHPVVPEVGSVGAGDLGPMAGMAQVAIGQGQAEYRGELLSGGEALKRAGMTQLVLSGKDGLALVSANGVSIGHAALVIARAEQAAEAADTAAALSMEATSANPSILHSAVARAKPIPGQAAAADHIRHLLEGSELFQPGGHKSVQDALSFRVVPQVHGAMREYVRAARDAVTVELNSADDNPLVSVPDQAMISNGNFHPMMLAIACDALRVAIAHVGQLSERRMAHLWDGCMQLLTGLPTTGEPMAMYGLQLRYPAAAVFPELKQLAGPATLDTPPLDLGVEDHHTAAPLSVRKTEAALGLLEDLLAIELMLASDLLSLTPTTPMLGVGTDAALRMVEESIAAADPLPDAVHRALRERFPVRPVGGYAASEQNAAR